MISYKKVQNNINSEKKFLDKIRPLMDACGRSYYACRPDDCRFGAWERENALSKRYNMWTQRCIKLKNRMAKHALKRDKTISYFVFEHFVGDLCTIIMGYLDASHLQSEELSIYSCLKDVKYCAV